MHTLKVKLSKKDKQKTNKSGLESSVIKQIIPEIELYQFEELTREAVKPEYDDFESFFDDFTESKPNRPKQAKKVLPKPLFTIYFSIPNYCKPIDINLDKVKKIEFEKEEIQMQVQSAYDKGFEDGQQATQLALAEDFNKLEDWVRRIDQVTENLTQEFSHKIRELKNAIVPIAIKVAEHILRTEIKANPTVIENQVAKALEILDNEKIFKIRLNPDDIEILEKVNSRLLAEPKLESVEIVPDISINLGGCIIEAEIGQIDATIESQLKKIESALSNLTNDIDEENV